MSEDIHKLQRALLDAADAGDTDGVEFYKAEITRRQARIGQGPDGAGGSAAGANPSISQGEANARLGKGAKAGIVKAVTETLPQVAAEGVKGLLSFALLPGEAVQKFVNKIDGDKPYESATEFAHRKIDEAIPPPTKPTDKAGVEIAGGGLQALVSPGNAARNLATGLLSTAGGIAGRKTQENLTGDNGGITGGIIGSLAGGTPLSIFKGRGNHQEMLAEALKGTKPSDFANARRLQTEANGLGVNLTPDQLFSTPNGLDRLVLETLDAGGGGGALQSLLMNQVNQAKAAARGAGNRLGANPGNEAAIRDLRLSAEGAIDDVRLTPAQRKLFDESGKMLNAPQIQAADARLSEAIKGLQASEARKPLQEFQQLLRRIAEYRMEPGVPTGPLVGGATGEFRHLPVTDRLVPEGARSFTTTLTPEKRKLDSMKAPDLDTMIKEALLKLDDLSISSPGLAKRQQGQISGVLGDIRAILDDITPTRVIGRDLETNRHEMRDALTAGLTGKIAGRHGVTESMPDAVGTLRTTLGANVDQEKAIATLAAALRNRAQKAAAAGDAEGAAMATRSLPQGARVLWDEAVDKAFASVNGRVPATSGSALYSAIVGSDGSAKARNFDQLMQGVAAAQGLDPAAVKNGMKSVLRVLEASGRNRQGVSFAGEALERVAGESALRDSVRAVGPLSGPAMVVDKLRMMGRERQYRELSKIFTDPNALQLIEDIGRQSIVSSRTGAQVQTLMQMLQQPSRSDSDVRAAKAEKAKQEQVNVP